MAFWIVLYSIVIVATEPRNCLHLLEQFWVNSGDNAFVW